MRVSLPFPRSLRALLGSLALSAALAGPAAAQAIVIDRFTDAFPLESGVAALTVGLLPGPVTRVAHTATQTGLAGVVGGERQTTLEALTPDFGVVGDLNSSARIFPSASGGRLTHSNDEGALSKLTLDYGAGSPLNLDLGALGPAGRFVLERWSLDYGTVTARLTLIDGTGATAFSELILGSALSSAPLSYSFDLTAFPTIDLGDVDRILLSFTNNAFGQDGALRMGAGGFAVIPEPSAAAALLAVGALALVSLRRRLRPSA